MGTESHEYTPRETIAFATLALVGGPSSPPSIM